MRLIAFLMTFLGVILCQDSSLVAQGPIEGRVVALDGGSANLLKACCPAMAFESLIQSEDESYQLLNRRAWLMRDTSCLIYRGDQLSMTSQFFLERLAAQGVPAIDIAGYVKKQKRSPKGHLITDGDSMGRFSKQCSFVVSLAFDRFRTVTIEF